MISNKLTKYKLDRKTLLHNQAAVKPLIRKLSAKQHGFILMQLSFSLIASHAEENKQEGPKAYTRSKFTYKVKRPTPRITTGSGALGGGTSSTGDIRLLPS